MTGRMVPTQRWGTAFVEEMTEDQVPQKYGCAECGKVPLTIFMLSGTVYCAEHRPNTSIDDLL